MAGIDKYTKIMLHNNGIDASTTFIDYSYSPKTVTANGNAQIDTAQKKFGTGSCLLDASSGTFLSLANSADFNPGGEDFTIDFWIRFNSTSGAQVFMGRNGTSDRSWSLYYNSGNLRFAGYWNSQTNDIPFSWSPSINTWYHVEVSRDGTNLRAFIDGTQIGSTYTLSYDIRDSSSVFYIGENVEDLGYRINGWMDEIRWSKGIARHTSNFTPETSEYTLVSGIDESIIWNEEKFQNIEIPIDENIIWNEIINTSLLTNEIVNVNETVIWNENNSQDIALQQDENIIWNETTDANVPQGTANLGIEIISINPLVFVSFTSPAKITKVDVSVPANITWEAVEITGFDNATSCIYNSTTGFVYISGSNGEVAKIELADLSNQTIINTNETDSLDLIDTQDEFFRTFIATDDSNGEIVVIDEREMKQLNTDLRWIQKIEGIISTQLNTILARKLNTDLRYRATISNMISTDLRWIKTNYDEISQDPINFNDIVLKINGTDLCPLNDVNLKSIIITHTINDKSVAVFNLNRKHDKLNFDNQGNASEITNNNPVIIQIDGHEEFNGKISSINADSNNELVTITAKMTQPVDQRHTISLPLPSVNEQLHLYHCLINNPQIDNPYIDTNDDNPEYYKGIEVDLGTEIRQDILKFQAVPDVTSLAEKVENGTFMPKQNWVYFWLGKATNFITGITWGSLRYLGTSLSSLSSKTWKITGLSYKYQKIRSDIETKLGTYQIGSAPYQEISVKNGRKIVKDRWEDKTDGLYSVRDKGYDYEQYAKDVADLEYQKLQNINGNVLPITSTSIDISVDGYYYYNVKLLTRINISNTTTPGIYDNLNGFPVSVKTITISLGGGNNGFKVILQCNNQKSLTELEEIDAQYPDEESDEYLFPEVSNKIHSKFDPNTWTYPA